MINYILIFLIIFTYFFNLYLIKRKTRIAEYKNIDFKFFPKIIYELSLGMNNQILCIKESGGHVILLTKYQLQNKWGLSLMFNIEEKYKDEIINICNQKIIEYFKYPVKENNYIGFEINVSNDISKLMQLLKEIFFNTLKFPNSILFNCVFTKKSVLTNLKK